MIFFPESLGQKCGCTLYMEAHDTWQYTVFQKFRENEGKRLF